MKSTWPSLTIASLIGFSALAGESQHTAPMLLKPTPDQAAWQDFEMGVFFPFYTPGKSHQ